MFEDGRPLFVQIAERIQGEILDGTYEEETQVPSTNELASFLRVNPATAGKGLNLLVDAGILYKRRGLGMFVAPGARERLAQRRREAFAAEFLEPLLREATKLDFTVDDLVDMIRKEAK